jgi:hypothetical protein
MAVTRRNIPEDSHLHTRRRETPKSHTQNLCYAIPANYLHCTVVIGKAKLCLLNGKIPNSVSELAIIGETLNVWKNHPDLAISETKQTAK